MTDELSSDERGACNSLPETPNEGVVIDSYIGFALDFTLKFGHESFMYPFVRLMVSNYYPVALENLLHPISPFRVLTSILHPGILVSNLHKLLSLV